MDYTSSLHDPDNPASSPWATPDENPFAGDPAPSISAAPADSTVAPGPISPGLFTDDLEHNAFVNQVSSGTGFVPTPTVSSPPPPTNPEPQSPQQNITTSEQPPATPSKETHPTRPTPPTYPQGYVPAPGHGPNQTGAVNVPVSQVGGARPTGQAPAQRSGGSLKLTVKISGLERPGKKDPILRFDVHTNLPRFRTTQYRDVRRLHSEFVKLADHLISANPECLVPAVPPAFTSAGAGTEEDEMRVKLLMQRWFTIVCNNPILMQDDEVMLFVESDFGYSPMVRRKQPATGVRRKFLKQFAPPPDDTPELAQARPAVKLLYLGTMDAGHKVDRLVKARRGLGLAEADFGSKISALAVQEPHAGLANAYRKLGKMLQNVGDCNAAQATAEATTLGDPFQYHSTDACIVKETLTNRQILIRDFLQAQEATRTRLASADRLKASSSVRRDKVDEAIASLEEARNAELALYQKTTRVTSRLVEEHRAWYARTASDLRAAIREFTLREIEAERRALAMLESVRPDVRGIDQSGGLSRLGREAYPVGRRTGGGSSQGPKGDAWSGIPRRSGEVGVGVGIVAEEEERVIVGGEDDENRLDARNAASRLAASTF